MSTPASQPLTPMAVYIRKTQPIYLPIALLFLVFTVTSGPNSEFWWVKLETKQFGTINVGALGICDSRACSATGLGYAIGNAALGETILSVPPFLTFHLFVIVVSLTMWCIHLFFIFNLHVIVGQYRRTGWLVWIFPLVVTIMMGVLLAGDNLILSDLRKEKGIAEVRTMGSFWLNIPAFISSFIWFFLSWDLHRLAKISTNPNLAAKKAAIEDALHSRRQGTAEPAETGGWGIFKPTQTPAAQTGGAGASLGGWGMPSFPWGGAQTAKPASDIYEQAAPAASLLGSMWPGRGGHAAV